MRPDRESAVRIHGRLIAESGGTEGLRDPGLLEAALVRPWQSAGGADAYPTPFLKAAALLDGIARNHPFVDGNKRLAITLAISYLRLKGYQLNMTDADLVALTMEVATEHPALEAVARRLKSWVTPPAPAPAAPRPR